MKRVRGTRADLFGRARHRVEERQLIEEYESAVRASLGGSYDDAVAVARSIHAVRGYDEIKSRAIVAWRAEHVGGPLPVPSRR
jgi:indolepyruvate ferredoxin oxidoreductase